MKIKTFVSRDFQENCYVIWDETTLETAIIDPGMMQSHEVAYLYKFLEEQKLKVKYILLTHSHLDHAAAAAALSRLYGVEICGNMGDEWYASNMQAQAEMFMLPYKLESFAIGKPLNDGDKLTLAGETIEVLATPGHTQGGITFYLPSFSCAFAGDTIFACSIGRTDLPGGNYDMLLQSIRNKIFSLPHDTLIYCGHGPHTSVDSEMLNNPYV